MTGLRWLSNYIPIEIVHFAYHFSYSLLLVNQQKFVATTPAFTSRILDIAKTNYCYLVAILFLQE